MDLDFLFIHAGRARAAERDILIMPLGLPALADSLRRRGFVARVLNAAMAELVEPGFSLEAALAQARPRMVGLDVHWHQQTADALAAARRIKRALPSCFVVAGGFTASLFDRELLSISSAIDAVVRGDAEKPLGALVDAVLRGAPELSEIPNLSWRRAGELVRNPLSYQASAADLEDLRYGALDLVINKDACLLGWWRETHAKNPEFARRRVAFYSPGRGCPRACAFCGGGRGAQRAIRGGHVIRKSVASAVRDLEDLSRAGVETVHVCFDPFPRDPWHPELFRAIRAAGLRLSMVFECWSLPGEEFVAEFTKTFQPGSRVILSPETAVERVRRLSKPGSYSNAALERVLKMLRARGVVAEVSFSVGLPHETSEDFRASVAWARSLSDRFGVRVTAAPIAAEPGSPIFRNPTRFGVALRRTTLADFAEQGGRLDLGYRNRAMPEEVISRRASQFERLCVLLNKRRKPPDRLRSTDLL